VPAAAVIPAPEVYANVAAVKTLVVDGRMVSPFPPLRSFSKGRFGIAVFWRVVGLLLNAAGPHTHARRLYREWIVLLSASHGTGGLRWHILRWMCQQPTHRKHGRGSLTGASVDVTMNKTACSMCLTRSAECPSMESQGIDHR